jgi:microcystin-dependent protein
MANYAKTTDFSVKDGLAPGTPAKRIVGSQLDLEFNNIQTAIATKADSSTAFFTGMIVMWSGSFVSIPVGWNLCDGTLGTPDLRNRFVVGAGGLYNPGNVGGSANAVVVSHTHVATVTDPGHAHSSNLNFNLNDGSTLSENAVVSSPEVVSGTASTTSNTTGITVANSTEGVSGVNANLPPYYALAYIMKL